LLRRRDILAKDNSEQADIHVAIIFADDEKMQGLNRRFRKEGGVTDVLAFPINEELEDGVLFLGEIVVNRQQARRQAQEYEVSEEEEIARLIIHGALHLLGYNDEARKDKQEMEEVQERIVKKLKIPAKGWSASGGKSPK